MIRRIILENYMSHSRTVIEPAAGLTVLTGPNNCGKSAVISALLSLRGDGEQSGDFMLRHGQKTCAVTIETDDGHTLTWQRKKSVSYVIDGVEIPRMGRATPDKLAEFLRLPVIEPAGSSRRFDLHFGLQKEPIFLIDSEADAARFFSASNDAERLLHMQQLQKERVREARSEERRTRAELARAETKLIALSPLVSIEPELVSVEQEHRRLLAAAQRIADLRALIRRIETLELEARRLRCEVSSLAELKPPPALLPTKILAELIDKNGVASRSLQKHQACVRALVPLKETPTPHDDAALRQLLKAIARAGRECGRWSSRIQRLEKLTEPPQPRDPAPMRVFVKQWSDAERVAERCRASVRKAVTALAEAEKQIVSWIEANPSCPICGGQTDLDRLLETGEHIHA